MHSHVMIFHVVNLQYVCPRAFGRHRFCHLICYSLCCHVCEKGQGYISYSLTTSILLSKQMGRTAERKKKKRSLRLRTFYSVTIKVIELVLIKQDT